MLYDSWDKFDLAWCEEHKCHVITCKEWHNEVMETLPIREDDERYSEEMEHRN